MTDREINLHPKNNPSVNLKPNIVHGNIPEKAVSFKQLDENIQNKIDSQSFQIAKNTADIAKNTADITKNTADITKNTMKIAKNTADITKNTADITKNTANIEKNTNNVASILQVIDVDTAKINPDVLQNSIDGSDDVIVDVDNDKLEIHLSDELQNTISTHTSAIATNTENITKNTADITKNTADITKNTADIAKFANDVAGTYVTKIELYEALKRGEVSSEVEKVYTSEINYIAENVMPSGKITKILGKTEKSENLLKHTCITGIKTTGINLWDEETELVSGRLRSKNAIRVIPNTTYYVKSPVSIFIDKVDENGAYISYLGVKQNTTLSIPDGCNYIKISIDKSYGTTYNHDICINKSDATINGNYYPYEQDTLNIEFEGNGVGTASDEINVEEGKKYQRFGIVDLGTLDYVYEANTPCFYVSLSDSKPLTENIRCAIYTYSSGMDADTPNMSMVISSSATLSIKNTSYNDPATFKTAMSGVLLVYELATPIVTDVEIENDGWLSNLVQDGSITQQVDTDNLIAKEVDIAMNVVVDNQ